MKTCLAGATALLIVGIGSASAQSVPRDKPDAHAVDAAKVATVEEWSKQRGSRVIWAKDPQQLPKTSAVETASHVDAGKVEAIDQQSKESGHRQVWVKYPERRTQTAAANRSAMASASKKKVAVPSKSAATKSDTAPAR